MKEFEDLTNDEKTIALRQEFDRILDLLASQYNRGEEPPKWVKEPVLTEFIELSDKFHSAMLSPTYFVCRLYMSSTIRNSIQEEAQKRLQANQYLEPGEEFQAPIVGENIDFN